MTDEEILNKWRAETRGVLSNYRDLIRIVRDDEREKCAKIVPTNWLDSKLVRFYKTPADVAGIEALLRDIIATIRNRKEQP